MTTIIAHTNSKLIKNLVLLGGLLLLSACLEGQKKELGEVLLETPQGTTLKTQLAITLDQQARGLSGIQDQDFADDQAMLFLYDHEGVREFWMPDTYFNLDIFYLDRSLRVIDVERNVPAHPGMREPIPRARPVRSWHVLELKASSPHARSLRIGDQLKWMGSDELDEIISNIHLLQ